MQADHAGVMPLVGFLDGRAPPADHGVEHDGKANKEEDRVGDRKAEQ
jgi:hypothetical protein